MQNLDKTVSTFGIPKQVISGDGPPFNSNDFQQFVDYLGFTHRKVAPYWPEANGEVERFMRTLEKAIRTVQVKGNPWKNKTVYVSSKLSCIPAFHNKCTTTWCNVPRTDENKTTQRIQQWNEMWNCILINGGTPNHRRSKKEKIYKIKKGGKLQTPFEPTPFKVIKKLVRSLQHNEGHIEWPEIPPILKGWM